MRELAQIGYVSENQDMPERLTVDDIRTYLRPFYPTWDRDLEVSISRELRLPLDRKIGDLSHGMRMKMALVCALPWSEAAGSRRALQRARSVGARRVHGGAARQAGEMTILISSHELGEIEASRRMSRFSMRASCCFRNR